MSVNKLNGEMHMHYVICKCTSVYGVCTSIHKEIGELIPKKPCYVKIVDCLIQNNHTIERHLKTLHRLPIGHNKSVNYVHFPKLITSFGNHVIVKYR